MKVLADMTHEVGRGEIQQLSNRHNPSLKVSDYFQIIQAKTSLLFAASARLGAMVQRSDEAVEQGMHLFGLHLGNGFQLIDDALDYCSDSDTLGKNVGDDLADGKATMPILYALQEGSSVQQQKIRKGLTKGSLDYLPDILEAIQTTNAIEYTKTLADKEIQQAIKYLEILPDTPYRQALTQLAQYAVTRAY